LNDGVGSAADADLWYTEKDQKEVLFMAKTKKQEAAPSTQPSAPQQAPLPGLSVDELKALLGDKEVLIMQLQKQMRVYQGNIAALAQELQARQEEIERLRGKGKKAAKETEAEAES